MNRAVCVFVKITGWLAQFVCFRTKIHYKNKKAQGRKIKGAAVLVSNHTSVFDYAVWMFVFPMRNLRCLMAELLFRKNPFLRWLLTKLGGIKADRNSHQFGFVNEAKDVLEKGGVVEIFPEARLLRPGEAGPLPFKPSAAYIAILTGAPIIPVYTNGSYFKFKRAHVMIGEKIETKDFINPNLSEKENIENLTSHMREVIMELGNELKEKVKIK